MGDRSGRPRILSSQKASKSLLSRSLVVSLVVVIAIFSTAAMASAASLNVNLDQCANGVPRQTVNCTWQNGDLNAQNSQWREGDGIPFRVVISGLSAGAHF